MNLKLSRVLVTKSYSEWRICLLSRCIDPFRKYDSMGPFFSVLLKTYMLIRPTNDNYLRVKL